MMNNEVTTIGGQLMTPSDNQVSLLDMRMDAKRFPRIGKVTREQAIMELSKIVSQAFLYRGQAADQNTIQFISCSLVDELQSDLDHLGTRNISFAELSRIIKRAVLQEEMFGISVASLYKVIMAYVKDEGHKLQEQVNELRKTREQEEMKKSIIAPMVQAYTGELLKRSKI